MKRKFLLPILSICMVVALVSVGFAAWLITGNTTTGATGQFNTYGVTNKYYTVTATPDEGAAIIFGNPNGVTNDSNNWFQFSDASNSDKTESLTAEFTITVKTEDTNYGIEQCCEDNFTNNNITFTFSETVGKLDSVISSEYIKAPSFAYSTNGTDYTFVSSDSVTGDNWKGGKSFTISKDMLNVDTSANTATVKVKITFGWGEAFKKENPYTYFNGANFGYSNNKSYAELNADSANAATCKTIRSDATKALKALLELNGKSYNVGLKVTAVDAGE